jgi:hypothetical protein
MTAEQGSVELRFGLSTRQVPVFGPTPIGAICANPAIASAWNLGDNLQFDIAGATVLADYTVHGGEVVVVTQRANGKA